MPTSRRQPARRLLPVLSRTVPLLWLSAPGLVSLLLLTQVVSGLTPAFAVLLGRWTVDGITRLASGHPTTLAPLVLAWVGTAALAQLTSVAATVLQGDATDHFTLATVTRLMDHLAALPGLDVLNSPALRPR